MIFQRTFESIICIEEVVFKFCLNLILLYLLYSLINSLFVYLLFNLQDFFFLITGLQDCIIFLGRNVKINQEIILYINTHIQKYIIY